MPPDQKPLRLTPLRLRFVTFLRAGFSPVGSSWMGLLIGVVMVNVLLGSLDGEASHVMTALLVLGGGLLWRTTLFGKRRTRLYENDPDSGKNEK